MNPTVPMRKNKAIMIVGTRSDAGKSTIVMALCRIFANLGLKVAPFKSQNMSLNSFVTDTGDEIARSQVVQAMAARVKPDARHNPILLKPKGNMQSQIILMGKPFADYEIKEYYPKYIPQLIPNIKQALSELQHENDVVVIEGAGSPAEINLLQSDIANLFVAKLIQCPVLLVGDIERGGVFASIYGTIELLPPEDRRLIKGFLINKFRGEVDLLTSGIRKLEELTTIPCLGVVPYVSDLQLPAEDSMNLKNTLQNSWLRIKIILLPKISNFTDFEPLALEPGVNLEYVTTPKELDDADLIFIPGTKNTVEDLEWMQNKRLIPKLQELHDLGKIIFGICGGFQILGTQIIDNAIESNRNEIYRGLGLLKVKTYFQQYSKMTQQIQARIEKLFPINEDIIRGYEIHMGKIVPDGDFSSFMNYVSSANDKGSLLGATNDTQTVFGTFLHGIWENDSFRQGFLDFVAKKQGKSHPSKSKEDLVNYQNVVELNITRMAQILKECIDFEKIHEILDLN